MTSNFAKAIVGAPVAKPEVRESVEPITLSARELIDTLAEAERVQEEGFTSKTSVSAPGAAKRAPGLGKSVQKKTKGTVQKSTSGTVAD
jgi:hypothetical protein